MKKVALIILDGWGAKEEITGNAIKSAQTPNLDMLMSYYPSTVLQASGVSVGLPWETMGNSEVGHLTIGAGKTLYQNLPRVTLSIREGDFYQKEALLKSIEHAKTFGSNIHLMGMVSDGAVHSHINHLYALLELLKINKFPSEKVFIHVFTDGRDTDPVSGKRFITELEDNIKAENFPGKIASIIGRYYAMDRNQNWDRIQKAYYCMVNGVGNEENSALEAIEKSYAKEITDEFIEPVLIKNKNGETTTIKQNDSVIFFNIREDRARQITEAFMLENFNDFDRGNKIENLDFTTMMEYEKGLPVNVVFAPENVGTPLGKVLSNAGITQIRIAETEKYAHVTYFFNGGEEEALPGEYRLLIPSPNVDSYDKTPEMSAEEIAKGIIKAIGESKYEFILANFANADMVGHTGNMEATIRAVEFVDECIGEIYKAAMDGGVVLIITADHGNAEEMIDIRTGEKLTEHTTNPVPFILVDPERQFEYEQGLCKKTVGGMLSDIAPTVLDIMEIPKPQEMSGTSLLDSI
ncbi:MAG: 2,3-bisphosphoglycerate-independent phosphoglycerate mutase [Candidatus Paceibacterota bacterium]